jgi:hypothetical protein
MQEVRFHLLLLLLLLLLELCYKRLNLLLVLYTSRPKLNVKRAHEELLPAPTVHV